MADWGRSISPRGFCVEFLGDPINPKELRCGHCKQDLTGSILFDRREYTIDHDCKESYIASVEHEIHSRSREIEDRRREIRRLELDVGCLQKHWDVLMLES